MPPQPTEVVAVELPVELHDAVVRAAGAGLDVEKFIKGAVCADLVEAGLDPSGKRDEKTVSSTGESRLPA